MANSVLWRYHVAPVEGPASRIEISLPYGAIPVGTPKAVYHSDRERTMYHYVYWWEPVSLNNREATPNL